MFFFIVSDIVTWVIDKEDSNGSVVSIENKDQGLQLKTMNKENIKHFPDSSDHKSLRHFRIRKHVTYEELSSDSDSDKYEGKISSEKNYYGPWNKKIRSSESSHTLNGKAMPKTEPYRHPPASPINNSKDNKTCLSTEEISVILSETDSDEKSESSQEKREKLHSIENVSNASDSKDKVGDKSNSPLKLSFNCSVCELDCESSDDLLRHEAIHRRSTVSATSHKTLIHKKEDKLKQNHIHRFDPSEEKSDFLDTFKNHLISKGLIYSQNKNEMYKVNGGINNQLVAKKTFRCKACNYYSSKILKYKTHVILFHSDKSKLSCEYCNYTTSICVNLATHMKDHLLVCPQCKYQCLGSMSLNSHIKMYHTHFKCSKCDFTCDSRRKYNFHFKSHLPIERFKCHHCKLDFSLKLQLKNHIEKHCSRSKPFKCDECDMCFSQRGDLKYHIRSHKKLYICDICKREFVCKSFLRLHLRWHDKGSFKCTKCNSRFSEEHNLKLHMRTHKSQEFKCDHCLFNGTNANDISKHICIDKLYNVQKRSLNFTKGSSETECELNSSTVTGESEKRTCLKQKSPVILTQIENGKRKKSLNNGDNQRNKSKVEILKDIKAPSNEKVTFLNNNEKTEKVNSKFRYLRQNLPESECELNSNTVTGESEKHTSLKQTPSVILTQIENGKRKKSLNSGGNQGNKSQAEALKNNKASNNKKPTCLSNNEKTEKVNLKLRSLRQNLPSRTNHKTIYKTEKINGDLQCFSTKKGKVTKVISKKIRNRKMAMKTRGALACSSKQNAFLKITNQLTKPEKKGRKKRSKLMTDYILKDLDCMKVIFSKNTFIKNLLIEPVRFVGGRYIECYYQSQTTTAPPMEHLEGHLRQRSILSCRLCPYKTNSQQLLQRHTEEIHTWDPAVVYTLFS